MTQTISIGPGITLRHYSDKRFKQGRLSIQLVRPMCREEAAMNALLTAVLLRGSENHPDLRSITLRLDELYGAAVGTLARRVGDYQAIGFLCGFMEDRFALEGDVILAPMLTFAAELLRRPALENGVFRTDYVESEKHNLISTIESELNDKRAYASAQMLRRMCRADSFGIPRLGEKEDVAEIDAVALYRHYRQILRTSPIEIFYVGSAPEKEDVAAIQPKALYEHYQKILRESPIELFYVGSADAEQVAGLAKEMFRGLERRDGSLPGQTPFHDAGGCDETETMEVAQGKLCMGFTTPITIGHPDFAAMQVCNAMFGAGMTSKLFMNIREKMSLCYSIGSGYYGSKGILTVSAGIDSDMDTAVRKEVLHQLACCQKGDFTAEELESARQSLISGLQATHDSPGSIEGYYATAALSGLSMTPAEYIRAIEAVTAEQAAAAAGTLTLHTVYFLKGGTQ